MKKTFVKALALFAVMLMLSTGCTKDPVTESPSTTPAGNQQQPTTTYKPIPLKSNKDESEKEEACMLIEKPEGEGERNLNTLIPLEDSTFDDVTAISKKWGNIGNSVKIFLEPDGFYGNCLRYTKDPEAESSFHTAVIDIAPYIKKGGNYTIRYKFKVLGSDETTNAFQGVIRTDSETSFAPKKNNGQTFTGTGSVGAVLDDTWYVFTSYITVGADDIGKGGKWRLGLQSIQEGIEEVYIDELEVFETSYDEDPKPVTEAQTWVANEVVLLSDKEYDDPFNDVDVDLVLTNGTETYTVPAFWDGGRVWRVRFVCTSAGDWTYTTKCTDAANTGLHEQKSTVKCTEYTGNLHIYKKGFLKTEENVKYFMYNDGTPFFYLGDTHWGLGHETPEMVKTIVKTRAEQGYNVFQSEPIGARFDFTDGITSADLAGLRAHDTKFQEIAAYGLVHTNAAHFFPSDMQKFIDNHGGYSENIMGLGQKKGNMYTMYDVSDEVKAALDKICRYWVARYSAYPVMWTLAQEVDNDFFWEQKSDFHGHEKWGFYNNPYRYVAEYFGKHDPYKHPLTAHQEGSTYTNASKSAFRDIEAHTWYATQWNPKVTGESITETSMDYWENGQGKPVIRYESLYYMVQTKDFGARARSWMSMLSGMAGCGYGAQGGWYYTGNYQAEREEDDGVDKVTPEEKAAHVTDWKGALQAKSSVQMTYMRNFFENTVVDWYKLVPRFDNEEFLVRDDGAYGIIASTEDSSKIVIYFYNFSDKSLAQQINSPTGGTKTGTVKKLEAGATYNYLWFSPVTGKVEGTGTFKAGSDGSWHAGEKAATDMVLYIYK